MRFIRRNSMRRRWGRIRDDGSLDKSFVSDCIEWGGGLVFCVGVC